MTRVRLAVQPRFFCQRCYKWPRFRFLKGSFSKNLSFLVPVIFAEMKTLTKQILTVADFYEDWRVRKFLWHLFNVAHVFSHPDL